MRSEKQRSIFDGKMNPRRRLAKKGDEGVTRRIVTEIGEKRDHVVAARKRGIGEQREEGGDTRATDLAFGDLGGHAVHVGRERGGAHALLERFGGNRTAKAKNQHERDRNFLHRNHSEPAIF